MKAKLPDLRTDEEAERFVATADLTEYDLSGMVPVRFEFSAQPLSGEAGVMPKQIPSFQTDEEARRFVDTADLSEYDLKGTPVRFLLPAKPSGR